MHVAEQCGYRAWGTSTQAATTTMLSDTHFDIVVLDSWLAASHTEQMLAGIKAGPRRPPVLAVSTGGAHPHDAGSLLAAEQTPSSASRSSWPQYAASLGAYGPLAIVPSDGPSSWRARTGSGSRASAGSSRPGRAIP